MKAEAKTVYPKFWKRFFDADADASVGGIEPPTGHFLRFPSSVDGVWFSFVVTLRKGARLELYIDRRDESANDALFGKLKAHKAEIERAVGFVLVWHEDETDEVRRRIDLEIETSGVEDEGEWDKVIAAFRDRMSLFRNAIEGFLGQWERKSKC